MKTNDWSLGYREIAKELGVSTGALTSYKKELHEGYILPGNTALTAGEKVYQIWLK